MNVSEIAENLFIFSDYGGGCNIGLVIGGSEGLIVDTGYYPEKCKAVKSFIEDHMNIEIKYVFNTHSHADHVFGNQVFSTDIISSKLCAVNMKQKLEEDWADAEIEKEMSQSSRLQEEWKELEIVLPSITFNREMQISLSNIELNFYHTPGHTNGSSSLYVKKGNVMFVGDNVFSVDYPTLLDDGNPYDLINTLKFYQKYDNTILIPGHGKYTDISCVNMLLQYWQNLVEDIRNNKAEITDTLASRSYTYSKHIRNIANVRKFFDQNS